MTHSDSQLDLTLTLSTGVRELPAGGSSRVYNTNEDPNRATGSKLLTDAAIGGNPLHQRLLAEMSDSDAVDDALMFDGYQSARTANLCRRLLARTQELGMLKHEYAKVLKKIQEASQREKCLLKANEELALHVNELQAQLDLLQVPKNI